MLDNSRKTSVIIMMYYMKCGGVEKALIEMLKRIDRTKYDVEVLLLDKKGELLLSIPEWVTVNGLDLSEIEKDFIYNRSWRFLLKNILALKNIRKSIILLTKYWYYRFIGESAPVYRAVFGRKNSKKCDIALDFLGYLSMTTYYVATNIDAKKKYTWLHSEEFLQELSQFEQYLSPYDAIYCVSQRCVDIARHHLSNDRIIDRVKIFYNFIDVENIKRKSREGEKMPPSDSVRLLTVGRLVYQKGFDFALEVGAILKVKGYRFIWYICGDGPLRGEIEQQIESLQLKEYFVLLGFHENPYGYMGSCDVYLQTSRVEGYATTLAEANIVGCYMVSTDVAGAKEIISEKNGKVVPHDVNTYVSVLESVFQSREYMLPNKETTNEDINLSSEMKLHETLRLEE